MLPPGAQQPRRATHLAAAVAAPTGHRLEPSPQSRQPDALARPARRAAAGPIGRFGAAARLVHPFPSILDGLVVAVVASVAGATPSRALALGASMTLLQFAIGTLNDIVDAPRDRAVRKGKPIADGLVPEAAARVVLAVSAGGGLLLAAVGGLPLVLLALLVLAIGAWYDLLAKGTRVSWLPLALGVPLLPVYGWYGAVGALPSAFAVLVPAAALAGAALAIANAVVDLERDAAAGVTSLAVAVGAVRAAVVVLSLQLLVAALALLSSVELGASGVWLQLAVLVAAVPVAGAVFGVLAARRGAAAREVAFEVQAVGLALLVVAWINALSAIPLD